MPFDTHQLGFPSLSLSLAVLVIALAVFPQLNILQNLLLFPAFTSLVLVVIVVLIVRASIRRDLVDPEDSVDTLNPVASAELGDDAASEEAGSLGSLGSRRHRALRSLAFTTPSAWSAVLTRSKWEDDPSPGSIPRVFRAAPPHLAARIDAIFGLVKGSFIIPWYSRISPSSAFPNAVEVLVRQTVANVISQGGEVDWSALVVSKVVPILETHLQHFRSVEHLSSSSLTPSPNPALPLPLPARAHPALSAQSHLGAGSSSPAIEAHLRGLLERALESALPESDRSEVVKTMVREVILGTVMMPMFDMLCDSDFWNRQIDEKGGQYLHEQYVSRRIVTHTAVLAVAAENTDTVQKAGQQIPLGIVESSSTRRLARHSVQDQTHRTSYTIPPARFVHQRQLLHPAVRRLYPLRLKAQDARGGSAAPRRRRARAACCEAGWCGREGQGGDWQGCGEAVEEGEKV